MNNSSVILKFTIGIKNFHDKYVLKSFFLDLSHFLGQTQPLLLLTLAHASLLHDPYNVGAELTESRYTKLGQTILVSQELLK